MTAGIKLVGVKNARLSNVSFSGLDVGIQADASSCFTADNLRFNNVGMPFDVRGRAGVSGTRIRDDPKLRQSSNKSFAGWRKPNGPPLPAFCPECKSVFPSTNYNFGSSYFYSRDNEEICPVCRNEHAKLSDGLFDLSQESDRGSKRA